MKQDIISVRLRFNEQARLGPGKVALLEAIEKTGSVAAAGAELDMSARRAWLLIGSLNKAFDQPVVATDYDPADEPIEARLTSFGQQIVTAYRALESDSRQALENRFENIVRHLKPQQ